MIQINVLGERWSILLVPRTTIFHSNSPMSENNCETHTTKFRTDFQNHGIVRLRDRSEGNICFSGFQVLATETEPWGAS